MCYNRKCVAKKATQNIMKLRRIIVKTELRILLLLTIFTFGFCFNPKTEATNVDVDLNCYFNSNEATEMYYVMENNTLTNEISIKGKNVIEFYDKGYSIPKKVEEKKEDIIIEDSAETVEEVIEEPQPVVEQYYEPVNVVQQPVIQPPDPNLDTASAVVNFALQFVGNPYVYGGNSLTNGIDCSGFTHAVYSYFGIELPRTAPAQGTVGNAVPLEAIQMGDLVLYGYNGYITHAALYIGNGQVVHALNPSQGIAVTSLYLEPIITVRRVL